jgi:hypothetical protein
MNMGVNLMVGNFLVDVFIWTVQFSSGEHQEYSISFLKTTGRLQVLKSN